MATGDHDWTAGEQVTAANVDDYLQLQTVQQFATAAARDTALSARKRENMVTAQADTNALTVYSGAAWSTIGPVHGVLTTWAPAIAQNGAMTVVVAYAVYQRIGRMVFFTAVVTVTSAGTSNNAITITLPVAATSTSLYTIMGTGTVADVSASGLFNASLRFATTTTVKFQSSASSVDGAYLGLSASPFGLAFANGDIVSINGCYEAGADA